MKSYKKTDPVDLVEEVAVIYAVEAVAGAEVAEVVGAEALFALAHKRGQTRRREPDVAVHVLEAPARGKAVDLSPDLAPSRAIALALDSDAPTLALGRRQDLALN